MITDRQQRFVEEYLVDLNATQAAIRAGYSAKTAASQGERLLRNVEISAALTAAQAVRSKRTEITQDYVLDNLRSVVERCMQAEAVLDREGQPTGEFTFNAAGANKGLELLGKHLGMFVNKIEINSTRYVVRMPEPAPDVDTWLAQSQRP
jgi:phage terminase small subunit